MKITSQQAAELLNCHPSNLTRLVRDGRIKNLAVVGEGKARANGKFELAEIAEFAKTYKPHRDRKPGTKNKTKREFKTEVISRTLDVLLERTKSIDARLGSIEFALITLDQKIDNMVKAWT